MDRGSFAAASAGIASLLRLEVAANNLANTSTPGFKRQVIVTAAEKFEDTLAATVRDQDPYAKGDHDRVQGVKVLNTATDFTAGPIMNTDNPLDVALVNEKDFFVVNTDEGPMYTRAGNFTLNGEGQITTPDGQLVQGDGGPITAPNGTTLVIEENGQVKADGNIIGRLQVVNFSETNGLVRREGSRFFREEGPQPIPVEARLVPNALEMSNVSTIDGIVNLINVNRGFELYTKAAQTIDELNQFSIRDVGSSR